MKDLVEAIEYLPDYGSEGNLIDEILLNSKFIEYDANDITEDGFNYRFKQLIKFKNKIKNSDFELSLEKNVYEGKLLSKIDDRFKLIYHFEFKVDSHYLVFSEHKKMYFYVCAQKNRNKPLNKSSNKLLYNYVPNVTYKKPSKLEFFKFILKNNETAEDHFMEHDKSIDYEVRENEMELFLYTDKNGTNYMELFRKGKLK